MKTRIINARILTMEEGSEIFEGELRIDGSRITYVGAPAETDEVFDSVIDAKRNLVLPGFKNAHTHSAMTFLRSSADDLPLLQWLNEQVFPFEAKLTADDIYSLSRLAILEYVTSGITAVMEMYMQPEAIAQAFNEMGMRVVQVGAANNFSQSTELVEHWYKTLNGNSELTGFRIGFHAEYTCSEDFIERIADIAERNRQPVFTHISEGQPEVDECIGRYGMTPVAFLAKKGVFRYGGAGYHLVHTTPEDIEILKENRIAVVTNSGSNMKLASGIAPIEDYLRAGIPVAIGTDGPASNNCLDIFREMFLTTGMAKLRAGSAAAVPAREVLKMVTCNAAKIMTIPDADVLAPGKLADLVMIDLNQPNMQPINKIDCNLVYSGSKQNVMMTMVHGRILYDQFDGRQNYHFDKEPGEIYEICQKIRDRILG